MTNPTTRYGHIKPEHQGKILNVKEAGPGEVEHHGGSFSKYMDNKNKKLQEQFDQQSAVAAAYGAASGHATSELFKAVSIMVNGFTTPSQADLKQIMAQHGGNFELYYHRGRITHIICSNLTDAKVKIFQRERDPTPVVRPEWVVESLQAGVILPLEEYVLWRLRDVPGQRTLSAFRQQPGTASHATEKPSHISAALPPSPYGKFAAAAAASSQGQASEATPSKSCDKHGAQAAVPDKHQASDMLPGQAADAEFMNPMQIAQGASRSELSTSNAGPAKALNFDLAATAEARASSPSTAEPNLLSDHHALGAHRAASVPPPRLTSGLPGTSHLNFHDDADVNADAAGNDESASYDDTEDALYQHGDAAMLSEAGAVPVVETERAEAPADPRASADYRLAQERAAAARAACDLLRGPPKSSRDDPHFMDSYYKSSRLSFIGRWKARIEALTATTAAHAPLPQTAHQPSALASALRGNQAAEVSVERSIIHLDMDCFFASVAALAEPAFKGKPLAVSHSSSAQGTGEVSSANYEARKFGIRASMFIAEAKKRCPHLIVMPYQFDKYEEVSEQVYRILLKATACVQPVSCDEAYLDVTGLGDPEEIVSSIRQQIFDATGCTASAGIGSTMLTARLATKKGKPNGQYRIHPHEVDAYLLDLEVDELPGVGWNICQKLKEVGIASVRDARASTKDVLQREIGNKTGSQVWAYAHGIDDRQVEPPKSRKSVGAECNWGIRFQNDADALAFMDNLAGELSTRMKAAGVRGRSISLKLKRRKTNAPDPPKFMGHGDCDNISRSVTLSRFTDAASELGSQGKALLRALRVDPTQIRGIGLNVTKLDTDPASAAAKPGSAAPSKVSAPPPSVHDPRTGPWVRFWQDKPQHWGVLPAVKSATELADANIGQHPPQADITSGAAIGGANRQASGPKHALAQADITAGAAARVTDRQASGTAQASAQVSADVSHSADQGSNYSTRVFDAQAVAADQNARQGTGPRKAFDTMPMSDSHMPGASDHAGATGAARGPAAPGAGQASAASAAAAAGKAPVKQAAFNMYSPSKGTLQVLQKPPSRGPSPRKQVPLDQMLTKQAAALQAHALQAKQQQQQQQQQAQQSRPARHAQSAALDSGSELVDDTTEALDKADAGAAAQGMSRVVLPHAGLAPVRPQHSSHRLQGLTLSQIDASVFAALPAEHQQELLHNLPKSAGSKPAGTAAAEGRHSAASDFAFVTKLANLQKAGHVVAAERPSSMDSDGQGLAGQLPVRSGTDGPPQASSGLLSSELSKQARATTGPTFAASDGQEQAADGATLDTPAVQHASVAGLDNTAAGIVLASQNGLADSTVLDRASLGERQAQKTAASKASDVLMAEIPNQQPMLISGSGTMVEPAQKALLGQLAQPAQHAQHDGQLEDSKAGTAAPESIARPSDDLSGDEALELDLDLDLMDEERTALAMHGQPASSNHVQAQHAAADSHVNNVGQAAGPGTGAQMPQQGQAFVGAETSVVQQQQQLVSRLQKGGVMVPHRAAAALPPASQIDASVLDALPLQVRRELEIAYGLAPKRSPNKGVKRGRQAGRGSGPARAVPAKRQRVLDPPQALARQAGRLAAHSRMTDAALSLTQVDPSVLSELPQELQDELAALLPSTSRAGAHNKQAQQPGMQSDMQHPAAARMKLVTNGRHLGNHAVQLEQEERAEAGAAKAKAVTPVVHEPASELWGELQIALLALLTADDDSSPDMSVARDDASEGGCACEAAVMKMQALGSIVLQWASRQVQDDLEDVYFLLRRLADFKSSGFVQHGIAEVIQGVQAQVQATHGAKLRLQSSFGVVGC